MQFNAKIKVRKQEYMHDDYKVKDYFVSVEANDKDEASDKIYNHYNNKSNSYNVVYDVWSIDFFTVID